MKKVLHTGFILVACILSACQERKSTSPVQYEREKIALVSTETRTYGNINFKVDFYRNLAYRCGREGYFTFVIAEREEIIGKEAPLWVFLHGGGTGYYDSGHKYHGAEKYNSEETAAALADNLKGAFTGNIPASNVLGKRVGENWRFLIPSMCDHDLYGGMGWLYPNDPNWNGTDKVEGLQATMSAMHFTVKGNSVNSGRDTSLVFLHGQSAGSAGAYIVSEGFVNNGIALNGALLDCYIIHTRSQNLSAAGCTPMNKDPFWNDVELQTKLGPFSSDVSLYIEKVIGTSRERPWFMMEGTLDPYCCGDSATIPEAGADGFSNNCKWVYQVIEEALNANLHSPSGMVMMEGMGHVISGKTGTHQELFENWFADVVKNAKKPVFP